MTWVKICGITNVEDALLAVEAGADALGFVFYEKSPRWIDPERAARIVESMPAGIERVGVVVNRRADSICRIADQVRLTAIQMHGDDEDPGAADAIVGQRPLKILAAISMRDPKPEGRAMLWDHRNVHAFLADSGSSTTLGGTGEAFDWTANLQALNVIKGLRPLVLAGGLNAANVSGAIRITRPWGVDVSSGVEARPGKKDPEKVRAFVRAVREADQASSK